MRKILRFAGLSLLSMVGLAAAALLLVRFCFREQVVELLNGELRRERVDLLRAAAPYAADGAMFEFAYRQDDRRAGEISVYFRLDTLVDASAATWDKTLALARFVAGNIPHANQTVQPETRNAVALWEYTRTVEPAFNCRLHSIMLHELLLASGVVNRFVTCMPADAGDNDCHVVNVVWLPEHGKWAMIDSDMQAWVADEQGVPLSLAEMRERYIAGEPMTVHPLLDGWNPSYYESYWAKNLYWFECWECAGYDREVGFEGRRVALLPPGFDGFRLSDGTVCTTDAARFWEAPRQIQNSEFKIQN